MAAFKLLLAVLLSSQKVWSSVQEAGLRLKYLEANVLYSGQNDDWKNKRNDFILAINQVNDTSGVDELLVQLRSFETNIKYSSQSKSWKQWKRNYWLVMTKPNLDISDTVSRFIIALMFLEAELLPSSHHFLWMMFHRNEWLSKCRSLIDPLHQLYLYDEMFLNVKSLLNEFGYSSLQEYKREANMVISNINSAAEKLDQVSKDTGIATATAGGLGIASGILGGLGLILAPFTAGTSLVLTSTGAALGLGSSVTSITSDIIQIIWDDKKLKEVEREFEKVLAETLALNELLKQYAASAEILESNLDSLRDSRNFDEFILFTSYELSGIREDVKTLSKLKRLLAPKHALSPVKKTAGIPRILGKGTRSLSSASSTLSKFLPVLSVASGIWSAISGANKIKEGSYLAKEFRKLTENLASAVSNILAAYEIDVESSFEEDYVGIRYDAQNRSEEWRRACFHGDMCVDLALLSYNVTALESEQVCHRYGLYLLVVHSKRISDTVRGFVGKYGKSTWISTASRYHEWAPGYPDDDDEGNCEYFSGTSPFLMHNGSCGRAHLSAVICS